LLTLTEFVYAPPSEPMALYVFEPNGCHRGPQWFRKKPKYSEDNLSTEQAKALTKTAMERHLEIRITDSRDQLVFHSRDGRILYPQCSFEEFWLRAVA
jgi:hypothetical protein